MESALHLFLRVSDFLYIFVLAKKNI